MRDAIAFRVVGEIDEETAVPGIAMMIPRNLAGSRYVEFAQRAEEAGFDELWIVEDLGFHGGVAQAATVLAATNSVRVGIGILPAAARNVAFAAMELNTLEALFPGRVIAGIGHGMVGWMRQVGAMPQSPLTLLGETLIALTALLDGQRVTSQGRYVSLSDVQLEFPAAARPPVLSGVRGPKSMELAGRLSDGVILAEPVTPEYLRAVTSQLNQKSPSIVGFSFAAIDDDASAARDRVRPLLASFGEPDWAPHIAPLSFAEQLRELREQMDAEHFANALPDAWVDELALVGAPGDVRVRLDSLYEAGATTIVLIPSGDPFIALEEFARLL